MPQVTRRPADGLYADGGLLSPAPTPHGLTWAWCRVESLWRPNLTPPGERTKMERVVLQEDRGILTCSELDMTTTENNLAETLAVLFGLEEMPDGWASTVYTDSLNALRRVMGTSTKMGGVPAVYVERLRAVRQRLGAYSAVLLGGHPTKADIAKGYRARDGKPVSIFNKECDARCTALKVQWWDKRRKVIPSNTLPV